MNVPTPRRSIGRVAKKVAIGSVTGALVIAAVTFIPTPGRADGNGDPDKISIGLSIAPVPLNMSHKDRNLVGLGSFIVNAQSGCNGCHSKGPATEYTGSPYLFAPPSLTVHQTKVVNRATYLGGGRDFGAFPAPASPLHIYSRNLTPDYTGMPEGGHSLQDFMVIMRTGKDFDHLHPTCATGTPQTASCVPYPFDGDLLQIMPWPDHQDMTDQDLRAIYEYLSAIPCLDTIVAGQPQLRNRCN